MKLTINVDSINEIKGTITDENGITWTSISPEDSDGIKWRASARIESHEIRTL
ncbi:hypothetical protein ACFL2Q_14360 [Thermodesulfobacteriota bacterium]